MSAPVTRAPGDVLVHLRRARDHVDRYYAEPLDLEVMARAAGLSKYHFHRLFATAYGITPAAYVCQRRVERAQDLLRATNLSVTEVCHTVGFTSLGSFSSRFKEIVGETPRQFQQRWGANAPRIPGCFVLMWGLAERRPGSASQEKQTD
jgi:transcriptional regulator GlxA family with amidase domain